ncbi:E3 ubiquitin-protein ligase ATL31 [Bienertia sinuspersici]
MDTDTETRINGECVVCLGVFEDNEMLRLLPKCGHVFTLIALMSGCNRTSHVHYAGLNYSPPMILPKVCFLGSKFNLIDVDLQRFVSFQHPKQ